MARKFVNVFDDGDGAMFCTGIYDDFEKALGATMLDIYDFKDSYRKEGDLFAIGDLEDVEGEGGVFITVKFKATTWNEGHEHYYYILFVDGEKSDKDGSH